MSVVVCALATACSGPSVLRPAGPSAARIAGLWWFMFAIATVVFVVVLVLIAATLRRGRRTRSDDAVDDRPAPLGEPFVLVASGVTAVVLVVTLVASLLTMRANARAVPRGTMAVTIVAHNWWWEARYPGAVTANEIHIPVGRPVRLRLQTADVIHSVWVPELGPKMDAVPGRTNELVLQADRPGSYRGQCAEFCGFAHAKMAFIVVAQPPDVFDDWLRAQRRPAEAAGPGRAVFESQTCAGCHSIRGTDADATLGPDLTHVASRSTLAAGTIANTADEMRRWITDPGSIKPGSAMPPTALSADELDDLVEYLMSLR